MFVEIEPKLMGIKSDRYKDMILFAQQEGCEVIEEPGPAVGSVYVTFVFLTTQAREDFLNKERKQFWFKHEIGESSPTSSCFLLRMPDGCSQRHKIKP
jgi:hypothetical protein